MQMFKTYEEAKLAAAAMSAARSREPSVHPRWPVLPAAQPSNNIEFDSIVTAMRLKYADANICVVGNNRPTVDNSTEIDSYGLIMRINKNEHMVNGKQGTKQGMLFQGPCPLYDRTCGEHVYKLGEYEHVFILERYRYSDKEKYLQKSPTASIVCVPRTICDPLRYFMTSICGVQMLHYIFPKKQIHLYNLDVGPERQKYINTQPPHNRSDEVSYLDDLIANNIVVVH